MLRAPCVCVFLLCVLRRWDWILCLQRHGRCISLSVRRIYVRRGELLHPQLNDRVQSKSLLPDAIMVHLCFIHMHYTHIAQHTRSAADAAAKRLLRRCWFFIASIARRRLSLSLNTLKASEQHFFGVTDGGPRSSPRLMLCVWVLGAMAPAWEN